MEQGEPIPTTVEAPKSKGLSFRGLVEVFYNPSEFFTRLKEHPKVLVPYVVYGILLVAFFAITVDLLVQMQLDSPQLQERLQGRPIPPQLRQAMVYQTMIGGPVVMLLVPLLAALLGLFWGNVVFGGSARFKQLLSVMLYGEIIFGVGMFALLPMILAKKSILVSYSLAVLASGKGPDNLLYLALSKIDLFLIWEIVAIGIGLSVLYKAARNKGFALSVLSMGLISILHVVGTAVAKLAF